VGPDGQLAVAAATGAAFVREIFTGTYASDMGLGPRRRGRAALCLSGWGGDVATLYNVSAEFAGSSTPAPARPGAERGVLLDPRCGPRLRRDHGRGRRMEDLEAVKRVLPTVPVLANTGVKHATVADVLRWPMAASSARR
jgi:uncharacterized protein